MPRTTVLSLVLLTTSLGALGLACSDDSDPVDAARDGAMDAPGDSATGDSAASDSAAGDTGAASDAATADGGDAGDAGDGGVDCSVIGCGAPVLCGGACDAPCGCCACGPTEGTCGTDGAGAAVATNCPTGCYQQTSCGDTGCGVVGGVAVCGSCGSIESLYRNLTEGSARSCTVDTDCRVLSGHCGVGLGGCYEIVNLSTTASELAALAAMYTAASCTAAVCDCAPPPDGAFCNAGTCAAM